MNIKKVIVKLLKEYAIKNNVQMANSKLCPKFNVKESIGYNDIGHNFKNKKDRNNKIWWWNNDSEEFHVRRADMSHSSMLRSDFEGRYDAGKNMVSVVDMGAYRKSNDLKQFNIDSTHLDNIPKKFNSTIKI